MTCQRCRRAHPTVAESLEFGESMCDPCYAVALAALEGERNKTSNRALNRAGMHPMHMPYWGPRDAR